MAELTTKVNDEDARGFLEALACDVEDTFCFRTFPDRGAGFGRNYEGTLDNVWSSLVGDQDEGHGVFVVVNAGGHKDADIHTIRAVFIDADGRELPAEDEWHVPPHLICQRDATHWHAYWLVDGLPLDRFREVQTRLAVYYGTDRSVSNPSRVMRLPGTRHQKHDPARVYGLEDRTNGLGRVLGCDYSPEQITEGLPEADAAGGAPAARSPARKPEGGWDRPEALQAFDRFLGGYHGVAEGEQWGSGKAGRDRRTVEAAYRARDLGVSPGVALDKLTAWDESGHGNNPPLGREIVQTKVNSAYRNAENEAGSGLHTAQDAFADIPVTGEPANDGGFVPELGAENRFDDGFVPETEIDALKPPEWLIKDTLPKEALSVMYGPPGSHKSFLALDMAAHLARGWDWAGYRVTRPARVLYVAGEGTSGLQKRSKAWRKHHGDVEPTDDLTFFKAMPRIADDKDWSAFCEALEGKAGSKGFDLVVFDTLARLAVGLNENDNGDIGQIVGKLEALQRRLGCAVLVVHHTGKDEARGMRGGSALLGAADTAFAVKKDSATASSLEVNKQKDAEAWRGYISFSAEKHEVGRDDENEPITSLAFTAGHRSTVDRGEVAEAHQGARDLDARENARVALAPEIEGILLEADEELTNPQLVTFIVESRIAEGTEDKNNKAVRRRIDQKIRDCLKAEKGKGPLTRMVRSWTKAKGPDTWKIQGREDP